MNDAKNQQRPIEELWTLLEETGDQDFHKLVEIVAKSADRIGPEHPDRKLMEFERTAFGLQERGHRTAASPDCFFREKFSFPNESGKLDLYPDPYAVTADHVTYWQSRAEACSIPRMRARYADLAWVFGRRIAGVNANPNCAKMAIDSYLEVADEHQGNKLKHLNCIRRASILAAEIGNSKRIATCQKALFDLILNLQSYHDNIGIWCGALDELMDNKAFTLEESQADDLIKTLEEILDDAVGPEPPINHLSAQRAADFLVKLYRLRNDEQSMMLVVQKAGKCVEQMTEGSDPCFTLTHLQLLYQRYIRFGMKEDAERVQRQIKAAGQAAPGKMARISIPVKYTREELDRFSMVFALGTWDEALNKVADHFVPNLEEIRKTSEDNNKLFPLQALFGATHIAHGNVVKHTGPPSADPDGNLQAEITKHLQFDTPLLVLAFDRICEEHALSDAHLIHYLAQSPVFNSNRLCTLFHGFESFFRGNWVSATSVFVLQFEGALRDFLELLGEPTNFTKDGGNTMQEKSLDQILGNSKLQDVLGPDLFAYLKVVLTTIPGFNLRHKVAHGLMEYEGFHKATAIRVLHCLLGLGLIRVRED